VQWVTLFFAGNLARHLQRGGHRATRAFAADLFTEEQGKRLFPLIGVGTS